MTPSFSRHYHIGGTVVPYTVAWSDRRETVKLSMDASMELQVTAPRDVSMDGICEVLDSRQEWILEKLYRFSEQSTPPYPKEYLTGEKLPYLGRQYPLVVHEEEVSEPELQLTTGRFHLYLPQEQQIDVPRKRQTVLDWYLRRAQRELPQRVERLRPKLGADDINVSVDDLEGRWGEYQSGSIRLHWRLILAPVRIQEYVVAHELAHTSEFDHSTAFWTVVGSLIPDYEDRRVWLRLYGNKLNVAW